MLPKWVSMPVIYGLIGLCITLGGVAGLQTYRVSLAHEETAKTTSALDKAKAEIAEEREQFATKARQSERAHAERLAAQRTENQGRLDRAISQERAVADGLRADNLRLQRRWTGCEAATASVPEAASSGPGADEAADDRANSAGRIVRAAAEADAVILGLQAYAVECMRLGNE